MNTSTHFLSCQRSDGPPKLVRGLGLLLLGICLAGLGPRPALAQATFTVDATGDAADANIGDDTCATSSGDCTLRAALQEANDNGTSDEIEFDISGAAPHTIQPQSALPNVTDPVIIDAASEPDYVDSPVVELDGQNAGSGTAGLTITRASTVQGLALINFAGDGLVLDGSIGNTIQSNYIGVAADGSVAGNGGNGLLVENGASSNLIGPDNVISNNSQRGIFIGLSGADDNTVYGNRIGTSPDGMSAMGNGFEGVLLNDVTGTTIGGTSSSDRNIISGNGRAGVQITNAGATSTTVTGNYIGVASDGTTDLGNDQNGVEVTDGASGNTIGAASGSGNVISGNTENGVLLTGSGTSSNTVLGNNIGTNDAGDSLLGNDGDGVAITSGASASIGGTADGAENVIAGNKNEIYIATSGNTLQGNYIGTNANGDDLGSSFNAIDVDAGSSNLIGGSASGAGNTVGFTATNSVVIAGSSNTVQGNFIGTNASGDQLDGAGAGLRLFGSDHVIGGTGTGAANTIAHNDFGVGLSGGSGHTVRGNAIFDNDQLGLDIGRDGVTPNDAGDPDDGSNRLQNFPEIQSASYDAGADEVTVTYRVPSDPNATGSGASAYDLTVDFYRADTDQEEGAAYLGTDTYTVSDYNTSTTGPDAKTITFPPAASVSRSDHVVATATDANGNTSEFSAQSSKLPVSLTALEATPSGSGTVALTWQVASEQNNAGFVVQHQGPAGDDWSRLGFVESAAPSGTTTEAQSYRYDAADLTVGTHRFRLRQVDLDGSATLTDPVTVELQMTETLRLSGPAPNPVHNQARLSFALKKKGKAVVTLYNVLGQRVRTLYDGRPAAGEERALHVPVRTLASGVYIVRLQALGHTRTRRLTVVQ